MERKLEPQVLNITVSPMYHHRTSLVSEVRSLVYTNRRFSHHPTRLGPVLIRVKVIAN